MKVPTPHNSASKGDIAKTVLMPGDPLRVKYIAENYLENPVMYNNVRGMYGYTGMYKNVKISVQGSGMGVPSMGIYSKELFEGYDVENIIRIGSMGALSNPLSSDEAKSVNLEDVVVATSILSDSNYIISSGASNNLKPEASKKLLEIAREVSKNECLNVKFGKVFTSDVFYSSKEELIKLSKTGVLGVEMETLALYVNAILASKNALAIYTVSDNPIEGMSISSEKRQTGFNQMIKYALEIARNIESEKK